jgi:NADPH:quinone reductase-like Zn-dependent oxidoreductase
LTRSFFGLLVAGTLKPVVSELIPLAEAAHAQGLLERGECAGKLVCVAGQAT